MTGIVVIFIVLAALSVLFFRLLNRQEAQVKINTAKIDALFQKIDAESEALVGEELQNNLKTLQEVYAVQSTVLAQANAGLAAQIKALAEEKNKGSLVTAESLAGTLDANIGRIEKLCANFEEAGKTLESSYQKLSGFIKANKPALNAINKLAGEFAQLRNMLTTYTAASENTMIEKINDICAALEHNVSKTWTNIDETLTRNAKELFEMYGRFFEICKAISQNPDEGWTEK